MLYKIKVPTEFEGAYMEYTAENVNAYSRLLVTIAKKRTRSFDYELMDVSKDENSDDEIIIATFRKFIKKKDEE